MNDHRDTMIDRIMSRAAPAGSALLAALALCALLAPLTPLLAAASSPSAAARPDPRARTAEARTPEDIAAARESFLMARESERLGDTEAALSWYALAFRHDARSRDLCFLYLERLKDAGAVDSARATARACEALAGDTTRGAPAAGYTYAGPPLTLGERKLLGEVALRAEDGAAALHHYREAWRLDEDDGDVLYVLAGLYEEVGDWEGHAEVLRRLLPRLDYPPRLMERLARTYARLDRPDAIAPIVAEAWEKTRSPLFGMTLAAHYEAAGRNLSLLRTARMLEEARPGPETSALLMRALVLADRPDSALILIARLRTLDPDDLGLRVMQVSLLFERGRYKEAKPLAAALVKDAPEVAAHHLLEGSVLLELRAKPKVVRAALERARALSRLSPDVRARRAYAEYALTRDAGDAAVRRAVDSLLSLTSSDLISAWADAGEARDESFDGTDEGLAGGRSEGANQAENEERRVLLEALAHGRLGQELAPREPGQRPAVFSDSAAARRHRRLAVDRYETILAKNSGQRAALFEAGALYERLGDLARSKELLRRLVSRDSTHATAMNYLAYTLIEQDSVTPAERAESDTLLTRALKLDPENGAFLDSRGWWHFRSGAPDSAIVWLEAAAEAVPGDPAVLDHLAQAQDAAEQHAAACATRARLAVVAPAFPGVVEGVKKCR